LAETGVLTAKEMVRRIKMQRNAKNFVSGFISIISNFLFGIAYESEIGYEFPL